MLHIDRALDSLSIVHPHFLAIFFNDIFDGCFEKYFVKSCLTYVINVLCNGPSQFYNTYTCSSVWL